jgi:hypothetical protein
MREVESASVRIADRHGNDEFEICPSRLSDIESKGLVPSIFRLHSLSIIYRCDLREILAWYGVDLSLSAADLNLSHPPKSHVEESLRSSSMVAIPTRLDPPFDPRRSTNLSRMVEQWGLVPLAHLANLSNDKYMYGYVGSEDFTMFPLLPPGTFLQVDESRSKIVQGMWRSGLERPIYFVETRDGYTCCWCSLRGEQIVLQPHPLSPVPVKMPRHSRVGSDGFFDDEIRIERACNTELKCLAEPPPKSAGNSAGAWLRRRSTYSPAVICNGPLETTTSSCKERSGVRSSLRNSRRCASASAFCAAASP